MNSTEWDKVISSKRTREFGFKDIIQNRELIFIFVKRDFAKEFKQTILGPIWFVVQPLIQAAILMILFSRGVEDGFGLKSFCFYFLGTICWFAFSDTLLRVSETLRANSSIFSKVYFPRIVIPFSILFVNYFKSLIQFGLWMIIFLFSPFSNEIFYYYFFNLLVILFLIFLCSFLGFSFGLLVSAMTTRYWDLRYLVQFSLQLLMFTSAVVLPLNTIMPDTLLRYIVFYNPISGFVEFVRSFAFPDYIIIPDLIYVVLYSLSSLFLAFFVGVYLFKGVERKFIDSI